MIGSVIIYISGFYHLDVDHKSVFRVIKYRVIHKYYMKHYCFFMHCINKEK